MGLLKGVVWCVFGGGLLGKGGLPDADLGGYRRSWMHLLGKPYTSLCGREKEGCDGEGRQVS